MKFFSLIFLPQFQFLLTLKYLFYRLVTRIAVHKAVKILVPAQTIKDTIIRFYPNIQEKIVITKEGAQIADLSNQPHLPKFKNTFFWLPFFEQLY